MEALGVVGSIIAIVQLTGSIITACQFYIGAVDGASSDLRVILIEVSALKGIIESLRFLTKPDVASSVFLDQVAGVLGPIEGCKQALKELEALFPSTTLPSAGQTLKRRKLDAAIAALAWSRKAGRAKKLLQEIIQHKTTINLALTVDFLLSSTKQNISRIFLPNICNWLETTNPSGIHNRSRKLYEPGTASWMLKTPEWPLWMEGKHRCLWINGIPGAGKSILASHMAEIIEEHCEFSTSVKLGYVYYYCYFDHNQDESTHFLRWAISQLCRQAENVPEEVYNIYKSGKEPSLSALLSALCITIENFARVYLILDAVDESMPREDLLRVIRDISTDAKFSAISLFVTSRQYIDIEMVMEACSIPINMSNSFVEKDIGTLVQSVVQSDAKFQRWPEAMRHEVEDTVPKKAKGMFRWAVCQLDILKRLKPEISTIRTALLNLPKTLDETYERIFLSIPEGDWLAVQHAFHWMVYHNDLFGSNVPLSTLLQAVKKSTTNSIAHASDQLHDFEGLRERCGCLIIIDQEVIDSEYAMAMPRRTTVSFAHYTVKEYLQSSRIFSKKVGFFALAQETIRKQLAEVALRQALATPVGSVAGQLESCKHVSFRDLLEEDFKLYCGVSSVLQLYSWGETISSNPCLMDLTEILVNPYRTAYPELRECLFMECENHILSVDPKSEFFGDFRFWGIIWHQRLDPEALTFLNLLLASGCSTTPYLAVAFTKKHSMLRILTQNLKFDRSMYGFPLHEANRYDFDGSIPVIVAQWAAKQPGIFSFILDLISKYGAIHFDLSRILLLYIGNHQHQSCTKSCSLDRLLSLGASANGPKGAFVTPLQIAVANLDWYGITTLLDAGAGPDSVGAKGSRWLQHSTMARFNRLHGMSPLYITRHFQWDYKAPDRQLDVNKTTRMRVEMRLLEDGAGEISQGCSIPNADFDD